MRHSLLAAIAFGVVCGAGPAAALSQIAPTKDAAERVADRRDKIVCKSFSETGSLVRRYRTCKSKWEWERERENLRTLNVAQSCALLGEGGECR